MKVVLMWLRLDVMGNEFLFHGSVKQDLDVSCIGKRYNAKSPSQVAVSDGKFRA